MGPQKSRELYRVGAGGSNPLHCRLNTARQCSPPNPSAIWP